MVSPVTGTGAAQPELRRAARCGRRAEKEESGARAFSVACTREMRGLRTASYSRSASAVSPCSRSWVASTCASSAAWAKPCPASHGDCTESNRWSLQ